MGNAKLIGLTGGIACGKSVVAGMLRELGVPVIDADLLARQVVEPGKPAYEDIVREFGTAVLSPDGTLDRKKLASRVFTPGNEAKRRRLNEITHPRIAEAARLEAMRFVANGAELVVYEAALLVENQTQHGLDGLIVVSCPPHVQKARLMERDGLSEIEAQRRLDAQLPLADKLAAADHVIDTSGPLTTTREEVIRLLKVLRS